MMALPDAKQNSIRAEEEDTSEETQIGSSSLVSSEWKRVSMKVHCIHAHIIENRILSRSLKKVKPLENSSAML